MQFECALEIQLASPPTPFRFNIAYLSHLCELTVTCPLDVLRPSASQVRSLKMSAALHPALL